MSKIGAVIVALALLPSPVLAQAPVNSQRPRAERLFAMGVALGAAGNFPGAQSYLRRSIETDPTYLDPYVALAEVFLDRGAIDDAREVLRTGNRYHQNSPALWRLATELARREGDLNEAARAARALVQAAPHDADAYRLRAGVARDRGAWSEALAASRALLELLRTRRSEPGGNDQGPLSVAIQETEATVRALQLIVGETDPVARCLDRPVRRALAGCDR